MKTLIIDDNEAITKSLSKFFGFKKIDCTIANDGRKGLEIIKNDSFDVVLLDLAMPDFTGYDFLDELVKKNKVKNLKIIVLTATVLDEDAVIKLKKYGIHSLQKKPMDAHMLAKIMV